LLEYVDAAWFMNSGWFASADNTRLEQQMLDRALEEIGPAAESLRRRRDALREAEASADDPRWLDLCVSAAEFRSGLKSIGCLEAAVKELAGTFRETYPGEAFLARLAELRQRLVQKAVGRYDPQEDASRQLAAELAAAKQQMLVQRNPWLEHAQLLFVKRHTYNSKHYYDDYQHISAWGGNLCLLSLSDGEVRELVPEFEGGVFDRYDLSFDAQRILFGYKRPKPEGFRIYEIGVDGSGLRQVSFPPEDEEERQAKYGNYERGADFYGLSGYRFWTDDMHPCYLPDGGICFASTRLQHSVLCASAHYLSTTNLFRMEADGSGLQPLSQGALSEFTPTVMEDGRILYNRWEYVYKGIGAVQPLWTMRPDGSGGEEFYGDNVANPGVFWQARQVPGRPNLVVSTGCGHEPLGIGSVVLIDLHKDKRTPHAMTSLTPDTRTEGLRGLYQKRNGQWNANDLYGPYYCDPYPLSDKFFLVACNPHGRYNDKSAYGIYLLDAFGNRVKVYDDPDISCWQPMLLHVRTVPPVATAPTKTAAGDAKTATVFISDVHRGLNGVPPGTVKHIRVMEQIPRPWEAEMNREGDVGRGHVPVVSMSTHIWIGVLHGVVPVDEDGSACFKVPAGRNIFFQALDEDFMEVQRMRTFVNFVPGEVRSCVGCHEARHQSPGNRTVLDALATAPVPGPQPGDTGPRPLHYPTDVQPIFDRHCVSCHGGEKSHEEPNLSGEMTTHFNRSYESIISKQLISAIREWVPAHGPCLPGGPMEHVEAVAPYTYGSHQSKLVKVIREGHHDVQLDREEFIRLVTWIDCNAPFYGSYFGRRNLMYKNHPEFRPHPTWESACGIAPEPVLPEPMPTELLAWWRFDAAGDQVAVDASSRGAEGQIVRAQRTNEARQGRALELAGRGYVAGKRLGKLEAVSVAMWVNVDALMNRWSPLLFTSGTNRGAFHFSLRTNGAPNLAVNTNAGSWVHNTAQTAVTKKEWHHVAVVCDGRACGAVRFYVDGQAAGEALTALDLTLDLDDFRIGGWNGWEGKAELNYHGKVDDVRIYLGTLSDQQVAELAVREE